MPIARSFQFTSESVTEGHPDKIADQVSDSVLDAVLAGDANGRVACETLITTGLVVVAGEITTEIYVDIPRLVRRKLAEIGYTRAKFGFDDEKRLQHDRDFFHCNPTGKFVIGGPMGDTGVTGRKIVVDTYGGAAPHGGGAFSGKDPTKVDRSAAYAARYVAKNVVAAGLAERFEIQLSYAIGVAHPLSISVETFDTGKISDERIIELINKHFDLRPGAIIRDLKLRRPIYRATAAFGHFGRTDIDAPWEKTDKADLLRREAGLSSDEKLEVLVPNMTGDGTGRQAKAPAVAAKNS